MRWRRAAASQIKRSTRIREAVLLRSVTRFGNLFGLGEYGTYILQVLFFALGIVIMGAFIRAGMRVEPFTTRR